MMGGHMTHELELKLQAYLDGELPSGEAKEVADLIAQNSDCRALLTELTHTRCALAGFEAEIKLPEMREFYWSKISREIQRAESKVPARSSVSAFTLLSRLAVASGLVVALLIGILAVKQQSGIDRRFPIAETDTDQAAAATFTYRDFASGTTLVWLSYPAENEFAESVSGGTIDWE